MYFNESWRLSRAKLFDRGVKNRMEYFFLSAEKSGSADSLAAAKRSVESDVTVKCPLKIALNLSPAYQRNQSNHLV